MLDNAVKLTLGEARTVYIALRWFIKSEVEGAGIAPAPEFYLLKARLEEYLNETYETFNDDYGG